MRINPLVFVPLACAILARPAAADVIHVAKDGPISTIQAGVDAASAGDTVKVKKGVYQETVTIAVGDVTVVADGKVVIDARGPGGAPLGPGIEVTADDVTLRKLVVRNAASTGGGNGFGVRVAGNRFRASRCSTIGCQNAGFSITGCDDPALSSCSSRAGDLGFSLDGVTGARFSNCSTLGGTGGFVIDGGSDARFVRCSTDGTSGFGILAIGVTAASADRCTLELADNGITLDGDGARISGSRARFVVNGLSALGGEIVVRDNRIEKSIGGGTGISAFATGDALVADNEVIGGAGTGVRVLANAPGTIVRTNVIRDCGPDAAIEASGLDATIDDNEARDCAGPGLVVALIGGEVTNNQVVRCTGDGVFVAGSSDGLTIDRNHALRCLAEGLDHRGQNSRIRNNTFKQCRLDLTNEGTAIFKKNVFKTGGENVPSQID